MSAFLAIDQLQRACGVTGDVLEIGAYLGKSAILLGHLRRDDERLVVCDLFEAETDDAESMRENRWYESPSRSAFECNYLKVHAQLPTIIQAPSESLAEKLDASSFRLVHVDGSHLYETVRLDLATARRLLVDGGVVICDDYRTAHTPGVAAAVWAEVASGRLRPLCLTESRLYGSWSPHPGIDVAALARAIVVPPGFGVATDRLQHGDVVRVAARPRPPAWKRLLRRLMPSFAAERIRRIRSRRHRVL